MPWQIRREGSPQAVQGLKLEQIVAGLRDGVWSTTDEVMGPGDRAWVAIENHPQLEEVAAEVEPPPERPHEDETRLDMNALIDVTLVLLIFFILTTTRAAALQKIVPLPTVLTSETGARVYNAKQVEKYMVRVEALGRPGQPPVLRVEGKEVNALADDGKAVDVEKLRAVLTPLLRVNPAKTELVLDARGVSWGTVVAIQDAAKGAGAGTVHHLYRKPKQ